MSLLQKATGHLVEKARGSGNPAPLKTLYIEKLNGVADRGLGDYRASFPAFLKDDIQENFSPSWDEEPMFGRVDMVSRYTNTKRTITFSFYLLALKGQDPPDGGLKKKGFDLTGSGIPSIAISSVQSGELPSDDYIKGKGMDYVNSLKTKVLGVKSYTDYHIFDNLSTCEAKLSFLRSLVYPKYANSMYQQPPMLNVTLSDQFKAVHGYITDLSITHQVVSGMGLDLNTSLFTPHGWEISISFTIIHREPPTAEGPIF